MTIFNSALELIGHTPVVKINHMDTGCCELFLKLENQNPGGSVKDRIALHLIEMAEKSGKLPQNGVIVEATSGNTGLSLAMVAALKGYRCIIVIPDKMSREKILHLKALGAEVVLTRSDVNKGHPEYYQDLAEKIVNETPNACYIDQFANPENPIAHEQTTGPEIWQQMAGSIDAFVAGIGTGGTLTGVGRYLRSKNSAIELILADPEGSILADYVNHQIMGVAKPWLVEGVGEDFIPPITELDKINQAITVSDKNAFMATRHLLLQEGLFGGSSTGILLHAALEYCRSQSKPKRVLTLLCDTGNKYLSKCFNDDWLFARGFSDHVATGDLRDLIPTRYHEKPLISLAPNDLMASAYARMSNHQISIIPVFKEKTLVGICSDKSMMNALFHDKNAWQQPIENSMQTQFATLSCTKTLTDLLIQFEIFNVVALFDANVFIGLVTPMDVMHYFKREST